MTLPKAMRNQQYAPFSLKWQNWARNFDSAKAVANSYGELPETLREYTNCIMFGGDFGNQQFIEDLPNEVKKSITLNTLRFVQDEIFSNVIIPVETGKEV